MVTRTDRLRACAHLTRWLGPWTQGSAVPRGVDRHELDVPIHQQRDRSFRAWLYRPRGKVVGSYLLAPGLHYAGPADPRLDRFCSILAAAGIAVLAPFLPDYTKLVIERDALADMERCLDLMLDLDVVPAGTRPGVFSISFGSILALKLAASPRREAIGGLMLFGGYADFSATIRFCLSGELDDGSTIRRDPLNQPVVFMNLLETMPGAPESPEERRVLRREWHRFARETWGRDEMKVEDRHHRVARRLADEMPESLRELYLLGCGVREGGRELCHRAMATPTERQLFCDPRDALRELRTPLRIVHGVEDDVIPYTQAHKFASHLPTYVDHKVYLTGLYGHTSTSGAGKVRDLGRELSAMGRIVYDMVQMASQPRA